MIEWPSMFKRRQRLNSLLGLALHGSRLEGAVLRRTNGSLQVEKSFSVSLSLDPLATEPELVGREIRNHLDAQGVRERRCILGVPLKWALATHVDVPPLPEADVESFLRIEAERGFPCDVATLHVSTSRYRSASGKQQAMLVGMPKNQLSLMEQVLRAAKLRPVSFSLGITALQPAGGDPSNGVLALAIGESQVTLQITCCGGVAALRVLDGALEAEGSNRVLHASLVAREARITLGQLPAEFRDTVHRIRIFGPRDLGQQLADEMELRLEPLGLKVELASRYATDEFSLQIPSETPVSAAFSLAARRLADGTVPLEFLPPRVTALQQLANRYSTGPLRMAGAAAGAAAVLVIGAFLVQQWQLVHLRSQWLSMAPHVKELEQVQQQIRQYRPWYDENARALTIMRQLTDAFPDDGVVSAKMVQIREGNIVTCTGLTRDYQALLKILDRLRAAGGVSDLRLSTVRGKPPMQFTFDFHWNEGGRNGG